MLKIKKIILLAAAMLFTTSNLMAYDFESGLYYNITSNTVPYTVEVTRGGSVSYAGNRTIPSSVTYQGITYTVTGIGDMAFANGSNLYSVTIPNTVTYIGNWAFQSCTRLTSVTIPNSVTSIGQSAFISCSRLTTVTIGNGVTSIPYDAFRECTNLTSVIIPNSVTSIGHTAFYSCSNLTSINIPNSVLSIGTYAFGQCSKLTSVIIPNSVTSIESYAFNGCTRLTSVTIGSRVDTIALGAFTACDSINSITFRKANTKLSSSVFNSTLPAGIPIHIPCGSRGWYATKLRLFSNFIEEMQFVYTATSQDAAKGTVTTVIAPTCNSLSWTVRATPRNGYVFSRWNDGNTQNPRTLTITHDTNIIAHFVTGLTVVVNSNDTLMGSVSGGGSFAYLSNDTILATPNSGYHFTRWSDGITTNPRIITVTQDTSFTALFSANIYNVAVSANDTLMGSVSGGGSFAYLSNDTILATPNNGYHFTRWSDGITTNPRIITVTQDTSLIAFFVSNQDIDVAESTTIKLYPNPASEAITIEGIDNETDIFVINAIGRTIRRLEKVSSTLTISVTDLPKGIYFVRVGTAVKKLIVE